MAAGQLSVAGMQAVEQVRKIAAEREGEIAVTWCYPYYVIGSYLYGIRSNPRYNVIYWW